MLRRLLAASILSISLTGCSMWGGSDEVEPNPLVDFSAERQVMVKWSSQVGDGPGEVFNQMTPALLDNSVFAASGDGVVAAFDQNTGSRLWRVELDQELIGGVGAGSGKVVVSTMAGELICLDAGTGAKLWVAQLSSEVVSDAQFNSQLVVAQQVNGRIVALNADTGEQVWSYESSMPRLTLRGTSSPLVALDVTLAGLDNGKFVALDNQSGGVLWEQSISLAEGRSELERMTDVDGRPLLFENVIYIPSYQGKVVAINPFNAQTLWSKDISSYHSLAAGFGNIYISEANDYIQALDTRTAASVWSQSQLENRQITSPVVAGNALAVADKQGYLHFMSQIDGHFIARFKLGSGVTGDMKVKDNTIYALTDSGRLYALTLN
ncbi:outer membrane protein assembly factor BamB [Neptunomonas phycophila]|uniref:Outer membrane protein assembly factor BamB n=1 Tax=Neptunomonas phycophila TaxID=1572645 RepID=A0ABT9EVZ8_9GAMM|nr:outer membrane protein assembly factor BamB [Neptunomonas phycophila]MDO6468842.1 outer membrane protein assembly factor BamB [Neptunomonas phycophila]MDP2523087.1 outer membrane protein assembly factor BamB [Neptunomonas phycophila]